jgi:hypothetical protein
MCDSKVTVSERSFELGYSVLGSGVPAEHDVLTKISRSESHLLTVYITLPSKPARKGQVS